MLKLRFALVVPLALLGSALLFTAPALASNPHFVSATGYIQDDTVHVKFHEAGLGDETTVHETLTATASCETDDGTYTSTFTVTAGRDFTVSDGSVAGSLEVTASCPSGQEVEIDHKYVLTDTTNGTSITLYGYLY